MTCPCCDEIVQQMRGWQKKCGELEKEVERVRGWYRTEDERADQNYLKLETSRRSNASLRGALTKAKKRIAEMKEGV